MAKRPTASHQVTIKLAHTLGYPDRATAQPHLSYIIESCTSRSAPDDYLSLVTHVIKHFTPDQPIAIDKAGTNIIQTLLDDLKRSGFRDVFANTDAGSQEREEDVEDHVMCIIGRWAMLLDHFELRGNTRNILTAYQSHVLQGRRNAVAPYSGKLPDVIKGSKILSPYSVDPSVTQDAVVNTAMSLVKLLSDLNNPGFGKLGGAVAPKASVFPHNIAGTHGTRSNVDPEWLSIKSEDLNSFTLSVDAGVEIYWTLDLSRHMCLTTKHGRRTLDIFALPCVFGAAHYSNEVLGISGEFVTEIRLSYAMLFNTRSKTPLHATLGRFMGLRKICWCWYCSIFRHQRRLLAAYADWCDDRQRASRNGQDELLSPVDQALLCLIKDKPLHEWDSNFFPNLWPRIIRLREHQLTARPWSIWMLFRDRRDTLQYWTFLFATLVLLMTLIQVVLGIAQVVGAFK